MKEVKKVDIMLLTHDHYDHIDYNVIKENDYKVKKYVVGLGIENHLIKWGINKEKIISLAWWEEKDFMGLKLICAPSRHFSGRNIGKSNSTQFSSWIFIDEFHKVYDTADTGYGMHFKDIQKRYGNFDLVLTDGAQYNERWAKSHMTPEEAYKAARLVGAKYVVPVHLGAYVLSTHPWDDPLERITNSQINGASRVITPRIGETMNYKDIESYTKKWWKNIK